MLDLLGVRHTVGSVDTLPPSREQLMAAFNTLHRSADSHMITEWEMLENLLCDIYSQKPKLSL